MTKQIIKTSELLCMSVGVSALSSWIVFFSVFNGEFEVLGFATLMINLCWLVIITFLWQFQKIEEQHMED